MGEEIKEAVRRQFGAHAANYVTSPTHAGGSDLPRLVELAGLTGEELVLDVATATGHTALALAPHAGRVIGVDLTPEMLDQARQLAADRGIHNVVFTEGDAERLPFADGHFYLVTCRIAAHHFPNVESFCREAARVLRSGGILLVVDNVAPDDDEMDRFMNEIEKLRDPSHHRAHRLSEWEGHLTRAGLAFTVPHTFVTLADREPWLQRMSVPGPVADEVRRRHREAPDHIRESFGITNTHFCHHKAIIMGRKP